LVVGVGRITVCDRVADVFPNRHRDPCDLCQQRVPIGVLRVDAREGVEAELVPVEAFHRGAVIIGCPAGEVAGGVGGGVAVGVETGDGVVEDVAVEVERLGIGQVGVGDGLGGFGPIGGEEAAEGGGVVAGAEIV